MEEKQITINGLITNYKVFGSGKPFLILHGWPSSSERWIPVAEILAQKYLVIVPDLPGFGKSQEPATAWNTNEYIAWINSFCENVDGLQKEFYLAGHSFGGALAAKFAVKYNQRVIKLFLISAATVRMSTFVKKFYYRLAKMVKIFSFLPYYALLRKAFYKFILRKSDYVYQKGIMKETYLKVISDDLSYKVRFITTPTVIIWGDKDTSTPLADGKFIHGKVPGSKLVIIDGADHSLHIKLSEMLAQKILENV